MITLLFLYTIFRTASPSLVLDKFSHDAIYVENYCPKTDFCREGTHVVCMYYNANSMFGPDCSNPRNISMVPRIAKSILDMANAVRSKAAYGKERGKDNKPLPRGYGIFRLHWDSELATFAQLLARQCILGHDECRGTKRFPNPGQTVGQMRFDGFPNWELLKRKVLIKDKNLTEDKMMYAVSAIMETWYLHKRLVTDDFISAYPDWNEHPSEVAGRLYLDMIYGPATHVGCGISGRSQYFSNSGTSSNILDVVCNFSAKGSKGMAVYNTTPPDPTINGPCGCPIGSYEDDDCLCNFADDKEEFRTCPNSDSNCKPTVVLLPIFSVKDAPPEKLFINREEVNPLSNMNEEIFNNLGTNDNSWLDMTLRQRRPFKSNLFKNSIHQTYKKPTVDVKNRYFDRNSSRSYPKQSLFLFKHKPSIFAKQEIFHLPFSSSSNRKGPQAQPKIMKDVLPRKDFSNTKLTKSVINNNKINTSINKHKELPFEKPTEVILKSAEEKLMRYSDLDVDDNVTNKINTEVTDSKLMVLLDNLEREVKNIELDGKVKELFDAKIRKIYGTVVGRAAEIREGADHPLKQKEIETDLEETFSDLESRSKTYRTTKLDGNDKYQLETTSGQRKQSSFTNYHNENKLNKKDDYYNVMTSKLKDLTPRHILRNNEDPSYSYRKDKYRNELGKRKVKRVEEKPRHYNDPLSMDRRRFYQAKLDAMEKKLHNTKSYQRRSESKLSMRPTEDLTKRRRSKNQLNPFYMHDGARYLNY